MRYSKCPNCGSPLTDGDVISEKIKCSFCGFEGYTDDYRETYHKIFTNSADLERAKNERHKFDRTFDYVERTEQAKAEKDAKRKSNIIKILIIVAAILIVIATIVYPIYSKIVHKNDIQIGISASELMRLDYTAAERLLQERGFQTIDLIRIEDLTNAYAFNNNIVTRVTVNGISSFLKYRFFPKDSKITIEYHVLDPNRINEIRIPQNHNYYIGKNYREAQQAFKSAGFENVILNPLGDVLALSKERGFITDIYVDGSNSFSNNTWVDKSSNVLITFHSTKGDKQEIEKEMEEEAFRRENEGKIRVPQSAKKYVGQDYFDVEFIMRSLGFSNVETIPLNDIKVDILNQENEVKTIYINGDYQFDEDTYFDPKATVVIQYHSRQ